MEQSSLFLTKSAIEQMKRSAKRVAKSQNISHSQALDQAAQLYGYSRWSLLQRHTKKMQGAKNEDGIASQIETLAIQGSEMLITGHESPESNANFPAF